MNKKKTYKSTNNIFGNPLYKYKKGDEPLYKTPKSTQQTIDIVGIAKNGIFELPGEKYSKTYKFSDADYVAKEEEEKVNILEQYCKFLSKMTVPFKITIRTRKRNQNILKKEIFFNYQKDNFDSFRELYNEIIEEKLQEGNHGLEQERYLTITIEKRNYNDAKSYFNILEATIKKSFEEMDSDLIALDAKQRLELLYSYYHMKKEDKFSFSFDEWYERKMDFKNDICNTKLKFTPNHIEDEEKISTILYIRHFPSGLSDQFLTELSATSIESTITIDINPINKEDTIKILNSKYLGVEDTIRKQQRKRNQYQDFSSDISYKIKENQKDVNDMIEEVKENDQTLFLVGVYILVSADTKEELEEKIETITMIANENSCQLAIAELNQREAFNSVLPIGVRQLHISRTMLTSSVAALHPYNVQELFEPGVNASFFYAINTISKNAIIASRKKLDNPGGWVFGIPGSGKSMFIKLEIGNIMLNTLDDIIIIDAQNECFNITQRFGGVVVDLSLNSKTYVNPLEIDYDRKDFEDMIIEKIEFLLSFCTACKRFELTGRERAIIDRCGKKLFEHLDIEKKEQKTLINFREILLKQEEIEAEDIAIYLEPYTIGTMDLFAHLSSVNVNNRLICYGLRNLGKGYETQGMLDIMSHISSRIYQNFQKGIATWIYIEEAHYLLKNSITSSFLVSSWKTWRKFGGIPTGVTQNCLDLIKSAEFTTLINNSEFMVLLKQAVSDGEIIEKEVKISSSKLEYVRNNPPGTGLIKYGRKIILFDMQIKKDNDLYRLYNTNFHEQYAGGKK